MQKETSKRKIKAIEIITEYTVWFLLFGSLLILGIFQPAFFSKKIIFNILIQASSLGVMTVGLAHVLLIGEIDLSIIGTMAFSAGIGTYIMKTYNINWLLAVLIILGTGFLIGLVNGLIVTKLKAASLIETIAMNLILMGALLYVTGGRTITNFPDAYNYIGKKSFLGIPILSIVLIVVCAFVGFIWNRTVFGRSLYAVGGNQNCAKASGINVERTKISAFIISSVLSSLAGWMYSAYMGAVPSAFGGDMQNYALSSAVIGGISLVGGIGRISGVLAGILLVTLYQVGLDILGLSPYVVEMAGGFMIMFAVIIDALKNNYKSKH